MSKFALLIATCLSVSGCSVYKSAGRKDFETNATDTGRIKLILLGECQSVSNLDSWMENDFSPGPTEILTSHENLEIWKTDMFNGRILLRSFVREADGDLACRRLFASELEWRLAAPEILAASDAN